MRLLKRSRMSFVRVLIEVEVGFEFDKEVHVKVPEGDVITQSVEDEYIPLPPPL